MESLLDNPRLVVVYIASPFTKGDKRFNVGRQIGAADRLIEAGFCPIWPLHSYYVDRFHPRPYDTWMALCAEWLRRSDILWRLEGESRGADMEVELARQIGIPVVYSLEELMRRLADSRDVSAPHMLGGGGGQEVSDGA